MSFRFGNIDCTEYYVGMAVAWALSESFIKFRERTLEVFSSGNVDAATQNRAIQKSEIHTVCPTAIKHL